MKIATRNQARLFFYTEEEAYNQSLPIPDFESIIDELFDKLQTVDGRIELLSDKHVGCDFLGSGRWVHGRL